MRSTRPLSWLLSLLTAAALAACGGGGDSPTAQASAAPSAFSLNVDLAPGVATVAQPSFHTAAVDLDEPDNGAAPHRALALSGVSTRGLTRERLDDALRPRALASGGGAAPMAASTAVTTYTPAQIRAAYGQPALPASMTGLSAAQAAQLGAGQTIYLINAKHDPNIAAELATFNAKFGLPACSSRTLAATASLPLAAASASGCELVIAYSTTAGALAAAAPAYDSGWATEIALDVQWAHATAPLARLVLIEAPDAGVGSLSNAVALANKMGPGVVSMSFGAPEGNWTASYDGSFSTAGMSYLAATGDNGAAVSWPSVSTKVVAVGGTTLTYSGSGARSETTWSGTGGGTSAYVALPSYQSGTIGGYARRAVADVAFNADPYSGQYVALIAPGATTTRWVSAGGTSLATPQWAGLLAVANAMRVASSKSLLGQPHAALYLQIGAVPTQYASAFKDVVSGSNGSCAGCTAKVGYDTPTGWGTPNVGALLTSLSGATTVSGGGSTPGTAASRPALTTTSLSGVAGKAFSGNISYSAPGATSLSITISGAPSGMGFSASSSGLAVNWANPVAGRSSLVITLKDNLGQTTTGTVTVTISNN
ncbi:S53 family peptidase [Roseateles sp.]|uniref:S53 family peptidase n=1 Tax=Roseateles sp. TaxID=1971397 RepID=UPI0025E44ACC|nr:S53 family peptidase [Roseateles sp.]MBV8037210.1 S53 family peptidase [Roseateles sp.]